MAYKIQYKEIKAEDDWTDADGQKLRQVVTEGMKKLGYEVWNNVESLYRIEYIKGVTSDSNWVIAVDFKDMDIYKTENFMGDFKEEEPRRDDFTNAELKFFDTLGFHIYESSYDTSNQNIDDWF